MNEERMWRPALVGGVLLGILSSLPVVNLFNCVCCAWIIGGGVLAAYLYVKDSPVPVTLGRGVALGLATGVIGAIVTAVFSIPLRLMMSRAGTSVREQLMQAVNQIPNMPPEARETLRALAARGDLDILFLVFGLLLTLVIYCLFAMLGGAIGVALFEKRKPGAPSDEASRYQPPANLPPPPPPDAL
jgi:hypothetical protein